MSYIHYGRIGDIWKHLPLCSILEIEKPKQYIESNSAYAMYRLAETPEQEYGIYTFLRKAEGSAVLNKTAYCRIAGGNFRKSPLREYAGSPVLAMELLSRISDSFVFFDLEKAALDNIAHYAAAKSIQDKVFCRNQDSIAGIRGLLPGLAANTFIHFDPYSIFNKNEQGADILEIFIAAARRQVKCLLWYGFNTKAEQEQIENAVRTAAREAGNSTGEIRAVEVFLKIIGADITGINPGIMGCGLLAANLSAKSVRVLDLLSSELVRAYEGVKFNGAVPGELLRRVYTCRS